METAKFTGDSNKKRRRDALSDALAPTVPAPANTPLVSESLRLPPDTSTEQRQGSVILVHGDLCDAPERFLVQQCNCVSRFPHGLSAAIARRLGADPYSKRAGIKNTAEPGARPAPGTIEVLDATTAEKKGTRVVCLYGQVGMGTSGSFSGSFGIPDSPADRIRYFSQALDALAAFLKVNSECSAVCEHQGKEDADTVVSTRVPRRVPTVAMPERIGCGLAGGDWSLYKAAIDAFATKHGIRVVLYRL